MKDKIIVIGGLIDFQLYGNQSVKQTILGLLNEYDVIYLSALPSTRPGLDVEFLLNRSNFKIFRLPTLLNKYFEYSQNFYKHSKACVGGNTHVKTSCPERFEDVVDYFGNMSPGNMKKYRVLQLAYACFEFFRVLYFISRQRPIFLYGVETYGSFVASIVGKLFDINVVKRFQGTPLLIHQGSIFKGNILKAFTSAYTINKGSDLVVMANDGTRGDEILECLGVHGDRVLFEVNGFTVDHLNGVVPYDLGSGLHIVMLSKLKIWKRVDRGIRLFEKLARIKKNVTLHIIGDGEMFDALVELSRVLKIEDRIIFHGALSNKEALTKISGCDLFWSFYDITNLGNPIMEAAYFERPIQTLYESSMAKLLPKGLMYGLDDSNKIVSEAVQILENQRFKAEKVRLVKQFKSRIRTWPERMELEISWIKRKLRAEQ